jgi:hypothetical protein
MKKNQAISPIEILTYIWPDGPGSSTPRIDVWTMNPRIGGYQTFGYWENGSAAGPSNPPDKQITLPIVDNGNFPGDPQPREFYEWLGHCVKNPQDFNMKCYGQTFP